MVKLAISFFAFLIASLVFATLGQAAPEAAIVLPEATPQSRQYCQIRYALYFVYVLWSVTALLIILQSGLAAKLRDYVEKGWQNWFVRVCIYTALVGITLTVLRMPLVFFASFTIEHAFGLSTQSIADWLGDYAKRRLIEVAIGLPAIVAAYAIVSRFRKWAPILWGVLVPFIFLLVFLHPLVIDPLLNKYELLQKGELHSRLSQLEDEAGIGGSPIYVVDKSRQTRKLNAFVTGIGSSARIVLWDTTVGKFSNEETAAVVAHEIGHHVLGHVPISVAITCGGLLILLLAVQASEQRLVQILPAKWGVRAKTDLTVIPAGLLFFTIVGFLLDPITNAYSRHIENEADLYALKLMKTGQPVASAFAKFSKDNLSDPDPPPFIEFWLFDHPPLRKRFDQAINWPDPSKQ